MEDYYRVQKVINHEGGMVTAAICSCSCCGGILDGMGGGGDFICQECLDLMKSGEFMRLYRKKIANKELD